MEKRISVVASAILAGVLMLNGCGGSSKGSCCQDKETDVNNDKNDDGKIEIKDSSSVTKIIDPTKGGVVVTKGQKNNEAGEAVVVVHAELNECNGVDRLGSRVACGPKEGVTYIFQSDFGKLGVADDDISTPDGGVLLYDALTEYDGSKFITPNEAGIGRGATRFKEIFIPTNYIVLDNQAEDDTIAQKYEYMREYLANVCNMKCISSEPENNPYFDENKTEGEFIASYVMHFTRGTGETALLSQYANGDKTNLEYLTVTFPLNVAQIDGNSSKLQFTAPAGSSVQFGAKKHGEDALHVSTTNININSLMHESTDDSDNSVTINMAKYFDKLIAKGDTSGVADFAKAILVENAQNPWPVKIYGTLIEKDSKRSFVRNPATIDSSLFNLDKVGAFKDYFANDPQAQKFNLVYPGGKYNKLEN